ncbi:MAG: DUF192 domain-containing protein [Rhodothermales bacterium]
MRTVLFLCFIMLFLTACGEDPTGRQTTIEFRKDGALAFLRPDGSAIRAIEVEIAENPTARQTGMMNRRSMTLNQGMLFIFRDEAERNFWMKNTPIPLDIIFVNADMKIIHIAKRTRPLSEERVPSNGPAQYVVEVRGGFCDRFGLTEDASIRWQRH